MIHLFLLSLFFVNFAFAEVGEILSLKGKEDAYLSRGTEKIMLATGTLLEVGDRIHTANTHVVLILYPKIQMSIAIESEFAITRHMIDEAGSTQRTDSLVDLVRGLIRIQVTRDENEEVNQKVEASGVAFAVRGTEYEVSSNDDDAELDVMEGEVEVSSPYVQTFVPEIVKPNQGFRFERKFKKFHRRAKRERLKDSRFMKRQDVRHFWSEKRKAKPKMRTERRAQRKGNRRR